jgi:hypothetical protein
MAFVLDEHVGLNRRAQEYFSIITATWWLMPTRWALEGESAFPGHIFDLAAPISVRPAWACFEV